VTGNGEEYRIGLDEFRSQAVKLLLEIKNSSSTTFEVPNTAAFLKSFGCTSIKASSTSKSDIRIVIHDVRTSSSPELGFSIKSQLGGASTLLNAGKTTNFIYEVHGKGLTDVEVEKINAIDTRSKIIDRINAIKNVGNTLSFVKTENATFGNNLVLIDSKLPEIVADIVLRYYSAKTSKMADLLNETTTENPLGFDISSAQPYYSYKVKRFLTDIALGMMPSKVWTGELSATGGYLVVKEDGDVLCYHIYNRNAFEDYLLNNTKLETASSSRHGFGTLVKEEGRQVFKLNLQIRFIK
ncbi:MAG: HpaII family restriction endonuclease, partial [Flavobacteriales bacterium]|nr:HpaII family restriction endonuclease [Flavobacteriales bacterium]